MPVPMRSVAGRLLVAVALVALVVVAGCSRGDDAAPGVVTSTPLAVEAFDTAVDAVEAELGGPQRYVEINATPDGVNLFVGQPDGREAAWFYRRTGELDPPSAPEPASGESFVLDGIDLSTGQDLVLGVQRQFPGALVTTAALVKLPDQGVVWALRSRSPKGGLLNLLFSPDGRPLSAVPDDGPIVPASDDVSTIPASTTG